jgi:hypothetical protein
LWFRVHTIVDGNVSIEFTSQPSTSTPLGDPTISTYIFYVNAAGALVLLGGGVALSLLAVNGMIAFRRPVANVLHRF